MSDTTKDDLTLAESSDFTSNVVNEEDLGEFTENQKLVSEDSSSIHDISFESQKESNLPNYATENAPAMVESHFPDCLISVINEHIAEIHVSFCSLFQGNRDLIRPSGSKSGNPVLTETRKKSKSNEVDNKTKSKQRKRCKSFRNRRKLRSSDETKKPKPLKLSKSSSDDLISQMLGSLEKLEIKDIETDKNYSLIAPDAAIKHGDQTKSSFDTNNEVQSYFSVFKRLEMTSSAISSSDSGTLTPGSDCPDSKSSPDPPGSIKNLSESSEQSSEAYLPDRSTRACSFERCSGSNMPTPCMRFKLSNLPKRIAYHNSFSCSKGNYQSKIQKLDSTAMSRMLNPAGILDSDDEFEPPSMNISEQVDPSVGAEQVDPSVRPKQVDPSVRPKQVDPSVRPKQVDPSVRPKQVDPSVRPKQVDPSVRPKQRNPFLRPMQRDPSIGPMFDPYKKLQQFDPSIENIFRSLTGSFSPKQLPEPSKILQDPLQIQYKLSSHFLSRRSYLMFVGYVAQCVEEYMGSMALLRENKPDNGETIHVYWKQSDATDWLKIFYYWDALKEDVKIMVNDIAKIHELFCEESISLTARQLTDFMEHLELVCLEARELHKACLNGMRTSTSHCSDPDSIKFFDYATSFLAYLIYFLRYLGTEIRKLRTFRKNELI